jgi:hypothetical protein
LWWWEGSFAGASPRINAAEAAGHRERFGEEGSAAQPFELTCPRQVVVVGGFSDRASAAGAGKCFISLVNLLTDDVASAVAIFLDARLYAVVLTFLVVMVLLF